MGVLGMSALQILPPNTPWAVNEPGDDWVRIPTLLQNQHNPVGVIDAVIGLYFIHVRTEVYLADAVVAGWV